MSAPDSLKEVYLDEMKDLWSANDQMRRALDAIAPKAHDAKLKAMLEESKTGIAKHTDTLKQLIAKHDHDVHKEHCKGMEGLVAEALKHVLEEAPKKPELLDLVIVAQYQRMTHYGIAGFGTAAAHAKALGLNEDEQALKKMTKEIYGGDQYATQLAEMAVNMKAKSA